MSVSVDGPLRVLVVDDDAEIVSSTAEALALFGIRVSTATSGAEAVRLASGPGAPDAVLLDLSMPGMDGFEAARRIRAGCGDGRPLLIAVTALESADVCERTEAAGFSLHLVKPVPPAVLAATARAMVGMHRAEHRAERRATERAAELAVALDSLGAEMRRRRELARCLTTAQEDERRRIARDLHDTVGQTLTGLALAAAAGDLGQIRRLADALGRELHEVAVRLRPTALDDLGLGAAVQVLTEDWSRRTRIPVAFSAAGLDGTRLPADVETALYRAAQESLTNVSKHAGAGRVSVIVGRAGGTASVIVEDDGAGFDPDAPAAPVRGGLGLAGMRERVALLGGSVVIESATGRGTTVIARIPLLET